MAVIATSTPMLSSVLMGDSSSLVQDYNYAFVNAKEAADTAYTLGQVVVYNGTDALRVLVNGDFTSDTVITSTDSNLPDGAVLGVVVGFDSLGDQWTKTIGTTATKVCVLFRGITAVKETGLVFAAGVITARRNTAKKQIEKQGIDIKAVGASVTSSFYGA